VIDFSNSNLRSNPQFGRSVAIFEEQIFIGAPHDKNGGKVYACTISDAEFQCHTMNLTRRAQNIPRVRANIAANENLGAAVSVSQKGHLVACAPRFQMRLNCAKTNSGQNKCEKWRPERAEDPNVTEYRNIPGRCFYLDLKSESKQVREWRPCTEQRIGNGMGDRDGFCQVGSGSISFSPDRQELKIIYIFIDQKFDFGQSFVFFPKIFFGRQFELFLENLDLMRTYGIGENIDFLTKTFRKFRYFNSFLLTRNSILAKV